MKNRLSIILSLIAITLSVLAIVDNWILAPNGIKTTRTRFLQLLHIES